MTSPEIRLADYANPADRNALLALMDSYARDELGGGQPLPASVRDELVDRLAAMPHAFSVLAFVDREAVGLANCFESLSTFKARPLINIHDLAVAPQCRGQGIGRALLDWLAVMAARRGCCKLTLEVLSGNAPAAGLYRSCGFAPYGLDPAHGSAQFWERPLP